MKNLQIFNNLEVKDTQLNDNIGSERKINIVLCSLGLAVALVISIPVIGSLTKKTSDNNSGGDKTLKAPTVYSTCTPHPTMPVYTSNPNAICTPQPIMPEYPEYPEYASECTLKRTF